jgi:hypothetical protein
VRSADGDHIARAVYQPPVEERNGGD